MGFHTISSLNPDTAKVLASHARRARDHKEQMEFLNSQEAEIKKKKSICTIFWGGWRISYLTKWETVLESKFKRFLRLVELSFKEALLMSVGISKFWE